MSKKVAEIYVKDEDGNISKSSIVRGMSAYDSALIGGYSGSEEEFYQKLSDVATTEDVAEVDEKVDTTKAELKKYVDDSIGGALNGSY